MGGGRSTIRFMTARIRHSRPRVRVPLILACCLAAGCGTLETGRVVSLGDVPENESVRRAGVDQSERQLLGTSHVFYRKLETSLWFEPSIEDYLAQTLSAELEIAWESLRVDTLGFRYAFHFPSRQDDFVLRIELRSASANLCGEFEARIGGDELRHKDALFGSGWWDHVSNTDQDDGGEGDILEPHFERIADRVAYEHRCLIQIVTQRMVEELRRIRNSNPGPPTYEFMADPDQG